MKDRIKQIMESQHMNQQSFAAYVGLSPATLSSILQERTRPSLQTVESLQKKFPTLNLAWLINGQGEMFITTSDSSKVHTREGEDTTVTQSPVDNPLPSLFDIQYEGSSSQQTSPKTVTSQRQQTVGRQPIQQVNSDMKYFDKQPRKITEIRVFYDDQTWESFVPKK